MAAASRDVKLLGARPSPYVNRVQIALNLKSVDYELVEENVFAKSELLLKSNPVHKKIPVLIHADKAISESLIILQYIDDVWTDDGVPSLLPSDPYDRALARFWAAYLDDKWFPLVRELRLAQEEETKAALVEKIVEGLALMDEAFVECSSKGNKGNKDFFGGDRIGFLDVAFGSFLGWLGVVETLADAKLINETNTPNLVGWAQRFCSSDAVKGVILETDKLLEIFRMIQARFKAASSTSEAS